VATHFYALRTAVPCQQGRAPGQQRVAPVGVFAYRCGECHGRFGAATEKKETSCRSAAHVGEDANVGYPVERRKKSGPRTSQIRFDSTSWSGASEPTRQTSFEAPRASKVELAAAFVATNGILLMHSACHMLSPSRLRSMRNVTTRASITN
jgi:hypothetical protein